MVNFCFECGAKNNGGKFCAECGTRFTTDSASAAAAAPPPPPPPAIPVAVPVAAGAAMAATAAQYAPTNPYTSSSYRHNPLQQKERTNSYSSSSSAGGAPSSADLSVKSNPFRNSTSSAFNGSSSNGSFMAPLSPPNDPVPSAASGAEAQQCYESCVTTIRASRGGNNEQGVKTFKQNCRLYGLKQIDVRTFYDSLVHELGAEGTLEFVPTLARLVPDDDRRKELVDYNSQQRRTTMANGSGTFGSTSSFASRRDSSSSADSNMSRSSSMSNAGQSKGILKNRYADHPNCDVCNVPFDVSKRRHQCRACALYICSSCSPVRLLVPPGKQIENSKGYDPSVPQRVCIQCAPELHQCQDELVATYAQAHSENVHDTRGRLHVPYSNSLMKECGNAADIIGNFFRDDWGASADRAIPVAFLQKAHGLAIMTIVKVGFLVTGKIGTGLVVAKLPDGSWSAPSAIGTLGLGGGFEIGGELIEVMIILGSEGAVKVFHKPQVNLGAGLDIAVGPYGRSALAAAAASTSGLNANYSYSQSKGLYAGISLQGAVIATRNDLNRKFYGRDLQSSEILSGYVEQPRAAKPLYDAIDRAMQGIEQHHEEIQRRSSIMGPCRLCNCPMFVAHTRQVWNKNCKTCKHVH